MMNLKTNLSKVCMELLETIDQQERLIVRQNDMIERLVNENAEQENMINELMKGQLDELPY